MARSSVGTSHAAGTTAERPVVTRTGRALMAVVVGLFAGVSLITPAFAQDYKLKIDTNNVELQVQGNAQTVTATVNGPKDEQATITAQLSGVDQEVGLSVDGRNCEQTTDGATSTCQVKFKRQAKQVAFLLSPIADSEMTTEDVKQGNLQVTISGNPDPKTANVSITGNREPKEDSISSVAGTVESGGEPIEGAEVNLEDSEGNTYDKTTDSTGRFEFLGSEDRYIAPGEMTLTVTKDGYETQTINRNVLTTLDETIKMPSTEEEAAEEEEEPASEDTEPATEAASEESGISGTLLTMIIIGAILVIGGIIAIILLLRSGKDDDDDRDSDRPLPNLPPDHQGQAAQVGSPGVYQASGPATQEEAPTMVHNGPLINDNEFASYGSQPNANAFGPEYDNSSTQVMPQYGAGQSPPPPPPGAPGGDDTTILPTVEKGGPQGGPTPPAQDPNADTPTQVFNANQIQGQSDQLPPPPPPAGSNPPRNGESEPPERRNQWGDWGHRRDDRGGW
ncbi:carboxypeptidase-like regulatory domain-containing protein [Haloglycomyces albus]|uniref:carboxypeptidase-like regulatory domain-containing protein n=1 Tax=Haloglycomyces albus TaxID=526067 RepID=UPI00046D3F8C|nr:carboxypeptidase-like regulatory domain-containing protein [Haloglycomyces albus]